MKMSQLEKEQKAFAKWCKSNLKVVPTEKTLDNKTKLLNILVSKYNLNIDRPNPKQVLERMCNADLSARTLKTYKTTFKQWLEFKDFEITEELQNGLRHQRGQRKRVVKSDDIVTREELIDIVDNTPSQSLKAYYTTLYDSGARPSAVCRLNMSDIKADRFGFVLRFRKTKTEQSKRNVRLLDPISIRHLELWLSVHPKRDDPNAPLFINRYGQRMKVESILNHLRTYHNERLGRGTSGKRASLNPYLFRKSRATALLRDGRLSETEIVLRLGQERHSKMLQQYYDLRDEADQERAELRAMGIEEKEDEPAKFVSCTNCSMPNEKNANVCVRCKFPLTESEMIRQQEESIRNLIESGALQDIVKELRERQDQIEEFLRQLEKSDRKKK